MTECSRRTKLPLRSSPLRQFARWTLLLSLSLSSVSCVPLTKEEAKEAQDEAQLLSQALTLVGNSIELSDHFTYGEALEAAAQNLHEFYASQLPCAEVAVENNSLAIEFGVKEGNCTHQGMSFSGRHEITISKNDMKQVLVDHVWTDLENGTMQVSGTAQVTWSGADDPSRHIIHDLSWTRLEDGRSASGQGDRTQRPLNGDLTIGFVDDGQASWEGDSGLWELDISEVEMRWRDRTPQAGSYRLDTPFNKEIALNYERTSANNVHVTAESAGRTYEFDVYTVK